MTLKDIAKEAGVSVSTVSRVINNKGANAASQEVRERIWEIVRRTGYVPNYAAQNLKLGKNAPSPACSPAPPAHPTTRFSLPLPKASRPKPTNIITF